jgi:Protein of unknown function (DUF2380)
MHDLIAQLYVGASMSKHLSKKMRTLAVAGAVTLSSVSAPSADERARPAAPQLIKIAVFDFELEDKSAGGGIIPVDEKDLAYLKQSTEEARRLLSESGRFEVIDTSGVSERNLASCGRCEGPLAQKLGAERAMIGLVTRITRTEYTIQLRVVDAATKETISTAFTGLRMGANYAWSRGVRSLINNRILAISPK